MRELVVTRACGARYLSKEAEHKSAIYVNSFCENPRLPKRQKHFKCLSNIMKKRKMRTRIKSTNKEPRRRRESATWEVSGLIAVTHKQSWTRRNVAEWTEGGEAGNPHVHSAVPSFEISARHVILISCPLPVSSLPLVAPSSRNPPYVMMVM